MLQSSQWYNHCKEFILYFYFNITYILISFTNNLQSHQSLFVFWHEPQSMLCEDSEFKNNFVINVSLKRTQTSRKL